MLPEKVLIPGKASEGPLGRWEVAGPSKGRRFKGGDDGCMKGLRDTLRKIEGTFQRFVETASPLIPQQKVKCEGEYVSSYNLWKQFFRTTCQNSIICSLEEFGHC